MLRQDDSDCDIAYSSPPTAIQMKDFDVKLSACHMWTELYALLLDC